MTRTTIITMPKGTHKLLHTAQDPLQFKTDTIGIAISNNMMTFTKTLLTNINMITIQMMKIPIIMLRS